MDKVVMVRDWESMGCSDQLRVAIDLLRDAVDAGDAGAAAPVVDLLERVHARVDALEEAAGGGN